MVCGREYCIQGAQMYSKNYLIASNCCCILLTLSSNFSEVRFSLKLSTFIGKQNGVNCWGKVTMIFDNLILSSIFLNRSSSICWAKTSLYAWRNNKFPGS